MITAIRRQFKGESLKYVLWVILFALAAGYLLPLLVRESKTGDWALSINDQEISTAEFAHQVTQEQERINSLREQYGQWADLLFERQGMSLDPRTLAYNYLVQQQLIDQVGHELGLHLSPEYIAEKISDPMFVMREPTLLNLIPPYVFSQTGVVNQELLQAHLRHFGISNTQFEQYVERALFRRLVLDILSSTVYVPAFDVLQRYTTDYVGKKYSIAAISLDSLIKEEKKNHLSDELLEQFFNVENQKNKRYWVPEKRSGVIWTFKGDAYGAHVSDEAIANYYEKNKLKQYVDEPVKVQVRRIVFKVANETERENLRSQAQALRQELIASPDQFVKKSEMVPFFARGASKHSAAFEQAAFLLAKDGDISKVIETEDSLQILQRVAKNPRTFKPLSSVKQEIKTAIQQRKFQEAFLDDMKRLARNAEGKQGAFAELAKAKAATAQKLDNVTKEASAQAQKLFGLRKDGLSSSVDNLTGYAVQVTDIAPAHAPKFETVRAEVEKDLYEHRARTKLAGILANAKKELGSRSLQDIASANHATIEKTDWLDAKNKDRVEALQKRDIPVAAMLQMEKTGSGMIFEGDSAGFIIRLDEIEQVNQADFKAKEASLRATLEQERGTSLVVGFVASLARNARIEINESLMQQLS
jgi:peptidyl-prolyl cis-trans isomerase D